MTVGVGPTEELSLRVSVATLSRVVLEHPETGASMLALEHKAHSASSGKPEEIFLQAQPFGGGARLLDPAAWQAHLGNLHFDSQRSQKESDFRIFIQPDQWEALKEIVIEQAQLPTSRLLDSDPSRELREEFHDTLAYPLRPEQFVAQRSGFAIEAEPAPTHSWRAPGRLTARIYCLDQVSIVDPDLGRLMLTGSRRQTPEALLQIARKRAKASGHGRANGMFIAPLDEIRQAYQSLDPSVRAQSLPFAGTTLSSNLVALFPEVTSSKYEQIEG